MDGVQCKKCRYLLKNKDGYNWCPNKIDDPDIDLIRDCKWYAVKTNADRIRSMSDEELASFINFVFGTGVSKAVSSRYWRDWLKYETEERET